MPTRRDDATPEQQARWQASRTRVGAAIRSHRIAAGLTQEALALESGLSRNALIETEHGRRGLMFERLDDLASVLGVHPAELLR